MRDQLSGKRPIVNQTHLARLRAAAGAGPVLILTHDNPDPDALAAGKALATLFKSAWKIESRLVYSGIVARAENVALLTRLTPEWEQSDTLDDLENYSAVALVDTQPGAGNIRLPNNHTPQIVFDHHQPIRERIDLVRYADVRPEIGATVTMLYQYLQVAGIEPDPILATAMFYGLRTDTRGLSREVSPVDEMAYLELLARMDRRELVQVEQAGLSRRYFRTISRGLRETTLYGTAVTTRLGETSQPDFPAEMSDLLIRLEDARAVLCIGQHQGTIHLSLRTQPLVNDAAQLMQPIVAGLGRGGGHRSMAGGQVPIIGKTVNKLIVEIERRFLKAVGASANKGIPLLND